MSTKSGRKKKNGWRKSGNPAFSGSMSRRETAKTDQVNNQAWGRVRASMAQTMIFMKTA
jgi:hypothetical protein